MKKSALLIALVLVTGSLFAQAPGGMGAGMGAGMGPGMGRGMGPGTAIDWKLGTVVTSEYKKATGQVSASNALIGNGFVFKADGVEYTLFLPRVTELSSLKNGDTVTIEGVFTSVKSDTKVTPTVHPFKLTINGKEIDLTNVMGPRGNRQGGRW